MQIITGASGSRNFCSGPADKVNDFHPPTPLHINEVGYTFVL